MHFFLFALIGIAAACIVRWGMQVRRRNAQTWNALIARLQPDWNSSVWLDVIENSDGSPEERWQRVHGASGLWIMYKNAKVMQEMADYAVRHNSGIDPSLLAELRSDALQIRMLVLYALTEYALHQVNEETWDKAGRAALTYRHMSKQMSELLQAGTPMMQFIGAR